MAGEQPSHHHLHHHLSHQGQGGTNTRKGFVPQQVSKLSNVIQLCCHFHQVFHLVLTVTTDQLVTPKEQASTHSFTIRPSPFRHEWTDWFVSFRLTIIVYRSYIDNLPAFALQGSQRGHKQQQKA